MPRPHHIAHDQTPYVGALSGRAHGTVLIS